VFAQTSDTKDVVREFGLIVLREAASITWPSNFHPRAEDVFTTILGVNVFWVSEYLPNEFIVSRWSVEDVKTWCLCFTVENAGTTVSMTKGSDAPEVSLLASLDGVTWNEFIPGSTTLTLANAGDKVYFKAGEGGNKGISSPTNHTLTGSNRFNVSGAFAASGSVMSLLDGENYTTTIEQAGAFTYLFYDCWMTQAPELPATTLADYCYDHMFYSCNSLTKAPELPATTLANSCYFRMFMDCYSLTSAPELPATTLADYCYGGMLQNCTKLTQAPALPATTLATYCYYIMFHGCTKLNNINVNFSAWVPTNATDSWVNGVASSGTFTCPAGLPEEFGEDRIPTGWTIVRK